MSERQMSCQEVQIQLDAWLTAELDAQSEEAIQGHLTACPQCREFAADLQYLRERVLAAEAGCPAAAGAEMIRQIARKQRRTYQAAQPHSRVRKWGSRLAWAAYALLGLALMQALQTPLAVRLFTIGLILNLGGLALVPFVFKNHESWSQV